MTEGDYLLMMFLEFCRILPYIIERYVRGKIPTKLVQIYLQQLLYETKLCNKLN